MKTVKMLLSASLIFAAHSSIASSVEFVKTTDNLETQACYAAASEGLNAAKKVLRAKKISFSQANERVMCNGLSMTKFASKYEALRQQDNDEVTTVRIVALSAMDQSKESQLCLDAVSMGEHAARAKHRMQSASVKCNGQNIKQFLKSFKSVKLVSNNNQEDVIASTGR